MFDLRILTARLEIRLPEEAEFPLLIKLVDSGIHDPSTMPFVEPWTDEPAPRRQRTNMQWWWRQRAEWTPEKWHFTGAVFAEGELVGVQDIFAVQFARRRSVTTGSWLGRRHQGCGLGREMRGAILAFAFESLGALEALSCAFYDNAASLATAASLGYEPNGETLELRRGVPDRLVNLRLTKDRWNGRAHPDVRVEGLDACAEFFGVRSTDGPGPYF